MSIRLPEVDVPLNVTCTDTHDPADTPVTLERVDPQTLLVLEKLFPGHHGVMFLDDKLCIRKYTSQMANVFRLLPQDVGRRFDAFAPTIQHAGLTAEVQASRSVRGCRSPRHGSTRPAPSRPTR